MPVLTGEDLHSAVLAKKSTSGGLDGWGWNELKALPLSWYVGLAWILRLFEDTGVWPDGLLDAYITMIPMTDGDSTPSGQRPLCVLPVIYRLWASVRLSIFSIGFTPRCLTLFPVLVKSFLALMPGTLLPWILRKFLLGR